MENVFIDTSLYKSQRYIIGKPIIALYELAQKKEIRILLPELTKYEVKRHLREDVEKEGGKGKIGDLQKGYWGMVPKARKAIDLLSGMEYKIVPEIEKILDNHLKDAEIICNSSKFDIKQLLDKYMNDIFPFSKGKKKFEFPDAIVLQQLEEWCEKKKETCIILSQDKDMQNYSSSYLFYKDYQDYINGKLQDIKVYRSFIMALKTAMNDVKKQLTEWTFYTLDNDLYYCIYLQLMDINQVHFDSVEIEIDDNFKVVGVTDKSYIFTNEAKIKAKIRVSHPDYDTGFYDKEDEKWYFIDDDIETFLEWEGEIPVELTFYPADNVIDVDSIAINNDNHLSERKILDGMYSLYDRCER